jgi:energy-converting hydrogenase A subunit R
VSSHTDDRRAVFFDLEGPLSPQDNALMVFEETMPRGDRVFQALSRYDDLLCESNRFGYEPGDTLALTLPFLSFAGLSASAVADISRRTTTLIPGSEQTISVVTEASAEVAIVSTSYAQHAHHVADALSVPADRVFATLLTDSAIGAACTIEARSVVEAAIELLSGWETIPEDMEVTRRLDQLFRWDLPAAGVPPLTEILAPRGGRRKVFAIDHMSMETGVLRTNCAFVGDSITDGPALRFIDAAGGLSVAFNANDYALRHANVGVAAPDHGDLQAILQTWFEGGLLAVHEALSAGTIESARWLPEMSPTELAAERARHMKIRSTVRQEAAELG